MTCPIPAQWFRRLLFIGRLRESDGDAPLLAGVLGFTVRFPGRTPRGVHRWLKSHGYVYGSGRSWCRIDRKPTRLTRGEIDAHADIVKSRRRRAAGHSPGQDGGER